MTTTALSKDRQQILKDMTPALRKKLDQLQKLHNDSEHISLTKRYEFSTIVAEIQNDPQTYGNASMDQIAVWFGLGVRNLYYFVSICNAIDRKTFDSIKDKVDTHGYKLTWTHLRVLASVDKPSDRAKLIRMWEKEALDSTEFTKRVQELIAAASPDKGSDDAAPRRANENAVRALLKQVKGAEERMKAVEQSDLSDFITIDKKRELLEQLTAECANLQLQMEALIKRINELQSEPVASTEDDPEPEEGEESEEIDDLLEGIEDESSDDDTLQSVVDNAMKSPPPVKDVGRRRKNGKPGSKAAKAHETKSAKEAAKKAKLKGKATGPAARRRRGEAAGV